MCRCHKIWEPQPPGTLRVCPGLWRDCFTLLWEPHVSFIVVVSLPLCPPSHYLFSIWPKSLQSLLPTTSSPSILSRALILQPWREERIFLRHLNVSLQDHMKSKTRNYADDNFDWNGRLITDFHHLQQIISWCTEGPSHVSYTSP